MEQTAKGRRSSGKKITFHDSRVDDFKTEFSGHLSSFLHIIRDYGTIMLEKIRRKEAEHSFVFLRISLDY